MTYNGRQVDIQEYTTLHWLSLGGLYCATVVLWICLSALLTYAESPAEETRLKLAALSVPLWLASLWLVVKFSGFLVYGLRPRSYCLSPNATLTDACPSRDVRNSEKPQTGRRASGARS